MYLPLNNKIIIFQQLNNNRFLEYWNICGILEFTDFLRKMYEYNFRSSKATIRTIIIQNRKIIYLVYKMTVSSKLINPS